MLLTRFIALALFAGTISPHPVVAQTLSPASVEAAGMSPARLARLGPALQAFVDRGEVAGAVALVMRNGRIVALETAGLADVASNKPMRPNTIFRTMNVRESAAPLRTISTLDASSAFWNATLWSPSTPDDDAIRSAPGRTNLLACARAKYSTLRNAWPVDELIATIPRQLPQPQGIVARGHKAGYI